MKGFGGRTGELVRGAAGEDARGGNGLDVGELGALAGEVCEGEVSSVPEAPGGTMGGDWIGDCGGEGNWDRNWNWLRRK